MHKQTVKELTAHFGIEKMLEFSQNEHGLIKAQITTATCTAEVYMQGAHLTQWQPVTSKNPVLFLSERATFEPGKAIRGGVPLVFPWFGAHKNGGNGTSGKFPSHGFARTSNQWLLVEAGRSKDDFMMKFELTDSDHSRAFGWDNFKLTYKISVGDELELELGFDNCSTESVVIEEALHTYLAVSDVEQVSVNGLADADFIDKTDESKRKKQDEKPFRLAGETDRVYTNHAAHIDVEDQGWQRKIEITKLHSLSTVIWNPWKEQSAKLADMNPDGWKQMVCVESANVGDNAVEISPGKHYTMHTCVRLK